MNKIIRGENYILFELYFAEEGGRFKVRVLRLHVQCTC